MIFRLSDHEFGGRQVNLWSCHVDESEANSGQAKQIIMTATTAFASGGTENRGTRHLAHSEGLSPADWFLIPSVSGPVAWSSLVGCTRPQCQHHLPVEATLWST